jgi:hypothetical protein
MRMRMMMTKTTTMKRKCQRRRGSPWPAELV